MGGFNSGRPRTRILIEDCLPLDTAVLGRLDCFQGLVRTGITWKRSGEVSVKATVEVTVFRKESPHAVIKVDRLKPQTLELTPTTPNLGGERWWFLCPITGHRCRVLYLTPGGDRFVSRQAAKLAYRSNRLGFADRVLWRAVQQRDFLSGAKYKEYPPRPKGMQQTTYDRIVNRLCDADEHAELVRLALLKKTVERLGIPWRPQR